MSHPTSRAGLLRAGRPHRPARRPARRGPAGRGARPGLGLPLRAVQPQGRRRAGRRRRGGHDAARHRHRGHQPQHPAPAGHRDDGDHAAPAQRRPLRARPRPRLRPALRRDGAAAGHRRAAGGRDRHLPHGCGTARRSATTGPAGSYPYLSPGPGLRRGHPGADDGDRPEEPRAGRPGRRRRRAAHLLHRRDARPRRTHDPRRAPSAPAGTRPRCGSGRCWPPSRSRSPRSSGCASWSGRLATYLQGYGEVLVRANGWDVADLERFRNDELVQGYPGAFDAIGTVEELTHLRDDVLPARVAGGVGHRLGRRVCAAHPGPARRRRGQRGAARRDTDRAGAGPRRVARRATGRAGPAAREPRTGCTRPESLRPATGRTAPAGRARPRSPHPCAPTRAARPR